MKRSGFTVLALIVIITVSRAVAQQPTRQAPSPTIVTVAFNAAVLQTAEAQRELSALQAKFAPRQAHLQTLNAEVEALKKQLNEPSAPLAEAEKNSKLQALDSKERQLQREAEDFKADSESASQQAFQSVAQKLYAFLQDYAKQHAYTLVIDRGSESNPAVWYAAASADITVPLSNAYNLKAGNSPTTTLPPTPTPH
jgi:outer membrane protein